MSTQGLQERLIAKIKNKKQDYIIEEVSRLLEFEEIQIIFTNSIKINSDLLTGL